MNENHELLQEIGVSCNELDHACELGSRQWSIRSEDDGDRARRLHGGFNARTETFRRRVAVEIERKGFQALRTTIGI